MTNAYALLSKPSKGRKLAAETLVCNCLNMYLCQSRCDIILVPSDYDECKRVVGIHYMRFHGSEPLTLACRNKPIPEIRMDYDYASIKLAMDLYYGVVDEEKIPAEPTGEQLVNAVRVIHYIGTPLQITGLNKALLDRVREELNDCVDSRIESPLLQMMFSLADCYPVIKSAVEHYVATMWGHLKSACSNNCTPMTLHAFAAKNHTYWPPIFALFGTSEDEELSFRQYFLPSAPSGKHIDLTIGRKMVDICRVLIESSTTQEAIAYALHMFCRDPSVDHGERIDGAWAVIRIASDGRFATARAYDNYRAALFAVNRYKIPKMPVNARTIIAHKSSSWRQPFDAETDAMFLSVASYVDENIEEICTRQARSWATKMRSSVAATNSCTDGSTSSTPSTSTVSTSASASDTAISATSNGVN